jgi:hypothetical protein
MTMPLFKRKRRDGVVPAKPVTPATPAAPRAGLIPSIALALLQRIWPLATKALGLDPERVKEVLRGLLIAIGGVIVTQGLDALLIYVQGSGLGPLSPIVYPLASTFVNWLRKKWELWARGPKTPEPAATSA